MVLVVVGAVSIQGRHFQLTDMCLKRVLVIVMVKVVVLVLVVVDILWVIRERCLMCWCLVVVVVVNHNPHMRDSQECKGFPRSFANLTCSPG